MKFMGIFLLLQFLFFNPAIAGLEEIYTGVSKKLYEFVNNETCEDLNKNKVAPCQECVSSKKDSTKDLNQLIEYNFFQQAAEEESNSLACSIKKVESINSKKENREIIKADVLKKLPILSALFKKRAHLKAEYLHLEGKANSLRVSAMSSVQSRNQYQAIIDEAASKKNEALQIHSLFEATIGSLWFGNTQAARSTLKKFYEKDFSGSAKDLENFNKESDSYFNNISNELTSNKSELESQSTLLNGERNFDKLNLKTKNHLLQNPYYFQKYSEKIKLKELERAQLQCSLEGKYGKGNQYLENAILGSTFIFSGAALLLSRVPVVLSTALGKGMRLGEVSFTSARVLTATSAGMSTHLLLNDFDKNCLPGIKSLTQKNNCDLDKKENFETEMRQIDEGNCALSLALNSLAIPGLGITLKNLYRNPLNATRALKKPEVISVDDIERIKNIDPSINTQTERIIELIRAESGRLGQKYVKKNPELTGSLKDAFEGPIEQVIFYPGQVLWQIQRSNQPNSGRWFSTNIPKDREEAEKLFNLALWGNDRGQMRMFVVKDEFTGYVGKVAGGEGNQLYIATEIPVDEVIKSLSFRVTPGGAVFSDIEKIPKKTMVEVTITGADGRVIVMQGLYSSAKHSSPGKFGNITLENIQHPGIGSTPISHDDKITIRELPTIGAAPKSPYAINWSKNIDNNNTGPVELTRRYVDKDGILKQKKIRGIWKTETRRGDITLETFDGKTISFPRNELNSEFSHKLESVDMVKNQPQLGRGEGYISNLITGDKIKIQSIEKDANGLSKTHTFVGEYVGVTSDYLILKRPNDIAPIFVSKYDIPNQKVNILKESPSVPMATNLNDPKWKWTPQSPAVSVTFENSQGKIEVLKGTLFKNYNPKNDSIIIDINGQRITIPSKDIVKDGLRLERSEVVH